MTRPILGIKGKGCAGSIASGVSTGKTRSMNQWSSHVASVLAMSRALATSMPAWAKPALSSSHTFCCATSNAPARSRTAAPCWAGVRPSGEAAPMPECTWPISPATRTEKNSSRLEALMETKRSRSSSGWRVFSASSTTR